MTGTASVKPIVVGVDGSSSALDAVAWAAGECARRGAPLRLVHGCDLPPTDTRVGVFTEDLTVKALSEHGRTWLGEAETAARLVAPDVEVMTDLRFDRAVSTLIEESATSAMVVLGSRGLGGFTDLLLGSVSSALAAHARCPVVVIRGPGSAAGPVVLGVDVSPAGDAVTGFAFEEASSCGVRITAVLAWTDFLADSVQYASRREPDAVAIDRRNRALLAERLLPWRERYPDVEVEEVVVRDRTVPALLRHAETARLLVVGSRGRGGVTGMLLGSTSQALVHHSPCPVAVVHETRSP